MLQPQSSPTRELVNLDGLWAFRVDTAHSGETDRWFAAARVFVRVDSATHEGAVYVEETLVARHTGDPG
ncbi:MAG: hypothetical protein ABI310_06185 [Microbacteriaceae bacterium]